MHQGFTDSRSEVWISTNAARPESEWADSAVGSMNYLEAVPQRSFHRRRLLHNLRDAAKGQCTPACLSTALPQCRLLSQQGVQPETQSQFHFPSFSAQFFV